MVRSCFKLQGGIFHHHDFECILEGQMSDLTLGLDLGPTSVGWALIDEQGGEIHGCGVRVFPEGVDRDTKGTELSKNAQRRLARAARRQIARRARRKRLLRRLLVAAGLLPLSAIYPREHMDRVAWEQQAFQAADPYFLRAKALSERLTHDELGRVLLHLAQRRGFLSNRKADKERAKETSDMLKEISDLEAELDGKTLGQYLHDLRGTNAGQQHQVRLRGRHTRRDMYEREFKAIWQAQSAYYSDLLTDVLREKVQRAIFFQRPLHKPSPSLIGRCELDETGRLPRCARADRRAQRFRLYLEVNNLRILDASTGLERALSTEERAQLVKYLSSAKERSFDAIRKKLFDQPESIFFNLERGGRSKLLGMQSDDALSKPKALGKTWQKLDEGLKDRIVAAIIDADEDRLRHLLRQGDLDPVKAADLLDVALPEGYASYSLHAIKRLLPHVERGLPLSSRDENEPCALREAGYLMPWDRAQQKQAELPHPPNITNPLVRQALHEVRKVVNAILRDLVYRRGHRLTRIHVELAREVRGTARQRQERTKEMRDREKLRDGAAERIRELGYKPTRDAIDRYLLWEEQDKVCIYSGRLISVSQLFGGEIDIDHILPRQRSLDNSLMNKVVCFRAENSQGVHRDAKGNRTPYEWLAASNPEKFEQVEQRAKKLPYPKFKRFTQRDLDLEDFFARQYVDTTYITSQVAEYVRPLGADVICPKGQHTATLRRLWGLDTILREMEDSPAWHEALELPPGEKNRLDHRHHAIDAVVIALMNRSRLQQLASYLGTDEAQPGSVGMEPWPQFRRSVEQAVRDVNVSHRVRRKVAGVLHEDTIYGPTAKPGEVSVRKDLTALTASMIADIRDPIVQQRIVERLAQFGVVPGRGGDKIPADVWREPLWLNAEKRIPVRRVRLTKRDESMVPLIAGKKLVKPGSVHHVCIFEDVTGKKIRWYAKYVTMLDAARRIRRHEALVQRHDPENPQSRFVMSLCKGDLMLTEFLGKKRLVLVTTMVTTQKRIHVVDAMDARPGAKRKDIGKTANSLQGARKVIVDPRGQIRWAND
ncbi:MAG: type II CRISPR RNA-guided endonuclease Cas9 [Pirellulales bacterium]|nr:type II CRISPR RNA-guided endonuclease Cas9 [Pirellulales bacterium]